MKFYIHLIPLLFISRTVAICRTPVSLQTHLNKQLRCNGFEGLLKLDPVDKTITLLEISKNNLTSIVDASFPEGFNNIQTVLLNNNNIYSIGPHAFKNLPLLEEIDLSHNNLNQLSSDVFVSNERLRSINLRGNNITVLDVSVVSSLLYLEEFVLSNNPLDVCDCRSIKALKYLDEKNVKTYFLSDCNDATKIDVCSMDGAEKVASTTKTFLPLFAILCAMLLFGIVLGLATFYLFRRLLVRENGVKHKDITIETGVDEDGYEIPCVPKDLPQYTAVLPSCRDSDDGMAKYSAVTSYTAIPDGFHNSRTPLIPLEPEDNPQDINLPHLQKIPISSKHTQQDRIYETVKNSSEHVYAEIMPKKSFYKRNIKMHMKQPYSKVNVFKK